MLTRSQLRSHYRQQRLNLSAAQQQSHAHRLAEHCRSHPLFQQSTHIAFYCAYQGEIDPQSLIEYAWQQGIQCYLPVLKPIADKELLFAHYTSTTQLTKNRLHILEPVLSEQLYSASVMDLIFVPLVAFDKQGQRLGMGGGYYDQTLKFLGQQRFNQPPYLIGLAHECQKIDRLPSQPWDIALHGVITEQKVYWFA